MIITKELLSTLGYTTKYPENRIVVYFSKDRETFIAVEGNHIIFNKFSSNDIPQEVYRGFIKDEEELKNIINEYK